MEQSRDNHSVDLSHLWYGGAMWSWGGSLAALAFLMVVGAACGQALPVDGPESSASRLVDVPRDNDRYTILEMATAHGAFTPASSLSRCGRTMLKCSSISTTARVAAGFP